MANLIMLEFGGFGMIREIKFKLNYIKDRRRAAIIIDELNNVFWVWLGSDITQKTRNQLNSVIDKLRANGHESEGIKVGLRCQNAIIIDQRHLNDPEMAQKYQKLQSLFTMPIKEKGKYLVEITSGTQTTILQQFTVRDKAIAGMLIVSLLDEFPALFIGKNAKNEYAIEGDQPLLRFKVINGSVQLLPGSINLSEKVQKTFSELFSLLS
ncbi:MAG: hypothetical protein ACTSQO_08735 [Candidatus Helarchaeota archaeon]